MSGLTCMHCWGDFSTGTKHHCHEMKEAGIQTPVIVSIEDHKNFTVCSDEDIDPIEELDVKDLSLVNFKPYFDVEE